MKLYITALFIALFIKVSAQDTFTPIENSIELKTSFKANSQNLTSIQSSFTQEKYLAFLSTKVISKGKFWYKKSDKLRWEYTEPFKFMVVMNGDKILVKDENQTNAYKKKPNNAFQLLNEVLASSVNGTLIDNSDYEFIIAENKDRYRIVLIPQKEESKKIMSKIELFFTKRNMSINEITMHEPTDDTITIKFENKQVNIPINDKVFSVE